MRPFRLKDDVTLNLDFVRGWTTATTPEGRFGLRVFVEGMEIITLTDDTATDVHRRLEALFHDDVPTPLDGMGDVSAIPAPKSDLADRMDDLEDRLGSLEARINAITLANDSEVVLRVQSEMMTAIDRIEGRLDVVEIIALHLVRRTIGSMFVGGARAR